MAPKNKTPKVSILAPLLLLTASNAPYVSPLGVSRLPFLYPLQVCTAEEAVQCIKSGDRIFVQGMAATPTLLTNAMAEHGKAANLEDCSVYHLHTEGDCAYVKPDCEGIFHTNSFFLGETQLRSTNWQLVCFRAPGLGCTLRGCLLICTASVASIHQQAV